MVKSGMVSPLYRSLKRFLRRAVTSTVLAASLFVPAYSFLGQGCSVPFIYYNDFDSRFDWRDDVRYAPPPLPLPWTGAYSFVVVSDTHIGSQENADAFGELKNKLKSTDLFVVVTGDIAEGGTEENLELFLNTAGTFPVPCYPVIGNHDIYADRGMSWKKLIGATVYRIDFSGTSLFFLDNANGAFGYRQTEWLQNGLKSSGQNTFVFAHENLFMDASPPDYEQITDTRERAKLLSLLKGRCRIMFTGHLHRRIIKEFGGVEYISLENYGSGGGTGVFCRVYVSPAGISREFLR